MTVCYTESGNRLFWRLPGIQAASYHYNKQLFFLLENKNFQTYYDPNTIAEQFTVLQNLVEMKDDNTLVSLELKS